ncbi:unnamed protein product [Dicrocoelium dendriticum]|nr:unnamed protein product [Dicrocoelium dendriticum]
MTGFRRLFLYPAAFVRTTHSGQAEGRRTPLYDFHLAQNAKLINFCGYSLPIQYNSQSIIDSHNHVRRRCGVFDVSHMLQVRVFGSDRIHFMETLTTADLAELPAGSGTLSVYLNDRGGILDDVIINVCKEPYLYVVSNAACAEKITNLLKEKREHFTKLGRDVQLDFMTDRALLAVQGPEAHETIKKGITATERTTFEDIYFMETALFSSIFGLKADGLPIRITRCGYTGEDGYEIKVPAELSVDLANWLTVFTNVKPVGLAARDTLRLEAGMCLYGNDLFEERTPVESSLGWLIGKRRRSSPSQRPFPGSELVLNQLNNPRTLTHKRIGLASNLGPPARTGAKLYVQGETTPIGEVTSGCYSPTLRRNIAMAYVKPDFANPGQQLHAEIREKHFPFIVTALPFVPNRFVRRPTKRDSVRVA